MNRRRFLSTTAALAGLAGLPSGLLGDAEIPATLTLHPDRAGQAIPADFLGLSYEAAQLAQPEFFSAQNTSLAGFLRPMGKGVLRIGGNRSEYAFWTPNPVNDTGVSPTAPIGPDPGQKAPPPTRTTPAAIRNLRQFLDMIDWRAMYGLNFGKGTPSQAAEEAAFVSETLGDRLISFQIGNEADLFGENGLRPKTYKYQDFAVEWQRFHDAVKARVPGARFAGPDTAGTSDWLGRFARQFGRELDLLTTHYYAEGPPTNPTMNIDRLLRPSHTWQSAVPLIRQAMQESHLPYRLVETNSCFGGGKPGVSNTFASALWALDLMFQVLTAGGSGINFHTGGYGWYAPVVGTLANGFVARPEYYAMLVMSQLVGGQIVESQMDAAGNPLLVAYAARDAEGKLRAVVINKNAAEGARFTIRGGSPARRISLVRLLAPRLDDEQDTTFAGSPVGAQGAFQPTAVEHIRPANGVAVCSVPAGSAALLTWE